MRREIRESLIRYARDGVPTGGFLRAVLENDLKGAMATADRGNRRDLEQIVYFVVNHLPALCHGSPARVNEYVRWLEADPQAKRMVLENFAGVWARRWCDVCGGLGRIEDTECDECEGRGYLLPPGPDTREERRGDK